MHAWELLAAALTASPKVEELVIEPHAACGERADARGDPWMALRGEGFAATCELRAAGAVCRGLGPVDGKIVCDGDWMTAQPIEAPAAASALLSRWPRFKDVQVVPVDTRGTQLPSMLRVAEVDPEWSFEASGQRLALRSGGHWRVTADSLSLTNDPFERPFEVDLMESFDASRLAGPGAWGIVSHAHSACGQVGRTEWSLTVLRPRGPRLETAARRSLGHTSWSRPRDSLLSSLDMRLRAVPSGSTLIFSPASASTDAAVSAEDAGPWVIRRGQFVRVTH